MIKKLLILACVLIPFYEVILYFFIPGRGYPIFPDMRITKEFIAMASCMLIGSAALYSYGFRKPKNVWFLAFICFLVLNIYKAPHAVINVQNVNFNGMWNYRPVFKVFAYFFLFLGISSSYFRKIDIDQIFKTFMYCGLGMSILMILQVLRLDQIFNIIPPEIIGVGVKHPEMGGSLGQATLCAPFLVMCIPFAVYFRKWLYGAIMAISVVVSGSSFAMLALLLIISVYLIKNIKNKVILIGGGGFLISALLLFAYFNPDLLISNGRFGVWKQILKELVTEKIAFTGAGLGAFRYFYSIRHQSTWFHAHNEYLQLLWCCGVIGTPIFFMAVKDFIKHSLKNNNKEITTILIAMASVAIVSCGTFLFQLAAYQFYLVVMTGIVYSLINGGRYEQNNL